MCTNAQATRSNNDERPTQVSAAVISFMPGQEYGHAVADVIFGAVNPSGKLPLTLPAEENQCPHFTDNEWPGVGNPKQANYTLGLLIGYRCFDSFEEVPAYPFGHGLSYSAFDLSELKIEQAGANGGGFKTTLRVKNTGRRAGAEVVQLYLGFEDRFEEPPQQLKQFAKVQLEAGASAVVTLSVTQRDLSIWDIDAHKWSPLSGKVRVSVGTSSRDAGALHQVVSVSRN